MAKQWAELQELNSEDLSQKLQSLKKEMFDLRMQRAEGKLSRPHRLKQIRRDVARVMTLLRKQASSAAVPAAASVESRAARVSAGGKA